MKVKQRQLEALGHLHQAQRLAIAFRARHAEIALDLALGVASLLVADDHHRLAVDARQSTHDRGVVGIGAIACQLLEFIADELQVVEGVGSLRVARELRDLPGRECLEDFRGAKFQLLAQLADLFFDVERAAMAGMAKLLDLRFQFGDGLFEIEEVRVHAARAVMTRAASIKPIPACCPSRCHARRRHFPTAGSGSGSLIPRPVRLAARPAVPGRRGRRHHRPDRGGHSRCAC
jgi:hypothetical protein